MFVKIKPKHYCLC